MGFSRLDQDLVVGNLLEVVRGLERRVKELERGAIGVEAADGRWVRLAVSEADVSLTPTEAELDVAFGPAASLQEGFRGIVNDAGGGTTIWEFVVVGGQWWRVGSALTAVT